MSGGAKAGRGQQHPDQAWLGPKAFSRAGVGDCTVRPPKMASTGSLPLEDPKRKQEAESSAQRSQEGQAVGFKAVEAKYSNDPLQSRHSLLSVP